MKILFYSKCSNCGKLMELPNTHDWREVDEADIEVFCSKDCEEIKRLDFKQPNN